MRRRVRGRGRRALHWVTWRVTASAALIILAAVLAVPFAFGGIALARAGLAAAPATDPGHVTILVLDMSGSMGSPGQGGNDPNGLRCSAAHAYIDLSGAGQWVGVVGLTHPFGAPGSATDAEVYAQPAEMSTDTARSAMRRALDTQSNGCIGDGTTPMADALAKADTMLHAATRGTLAGSVILLTDGLPDPDASGQIGQIHQLLPDFQAHNWPIDTIALGDADRGFLSGLADATGGKAYDVAHGPVPGVSPLNLEPFFVDIYRLNSGRTLQHAVLPLTLASATARQFHVGRFVAHIDVLVVRDSTNVAVQLYAPGNYPSAPEQAGQARIVQTDAHYVIYAIDAPVRGDWTLTFSGSGQVLADTLIASTLALQLVSPHANQHLPVGLGLQFNAALRDGSDQVLAEPVTVSAALTPANVSQATGQEVPLSDPGGANPTGNFTGRVTVPLSSPRGTYLISLQATLNDAQVSLSVPVVFESFPIPTVLSPSTGAPQLKGLALAVVPNAPLSLAFGLTVDGKLQAEPNVSATLSNGSVPISLTAANGEWEGTYIPTANGTQPLTVRLAGSFHGTDLAAWSYTLPVSIALRPSLVVQGLDARRPYPAHRTVTVSVAYFRQAGTPDPTAAGHISALLLPPSGIGMPLALQPQTQANGVPIPGAFSMTLTFGDPGTYTLHAIFDDTVASDHSEALFVLRVIDFPFAMTAPMAPGQSLPSWGPLGGLYSVPVVSWFAGPPLGGQPSQPTATLHGQVLLAGHPYTGGTVRAVAFAVGSTRPVPATVILSGSAYTVSFQPPASGPYTVIVSWVGDFAGVKADQEPTTTLLQASIVSPDLVGWGRAWAVTVLYLLLLLFLAQLGRFGLTPSPDGALQASGRPDDLVLLRHSRTPLWRRYLWRNRVRTSDIGLPPGAEIRFPRSRGPLVAAERSVAAGASITVGGTLLHPGAPPVQLEGAVLGFGQPAFAADDPFGDERSDDPHDLHRARANKHMASDDQATMAAQYIYKSPAELKEHEEAHDPWASLSAAGDVSGDPFDDAPRRPASVVGQAGAFLALFWPRRRSASDEGDGDPYLDDEAPSRRTRTSRRTRADDLDDGFEPTRASRRSRSARRDRFDDLDDVEASAYRPRASARRATRDDVDGFGDMDSAPARKRRGAQPPHRDPFDDLDPGW